MEFDQQIEQYNADNTTWNRKKKNPANRLNKKQDLRGTIFSGERIFRRKCSKSIFFINSGRNFFR